MGPPSAQSKSIARIRSSGLVDEIACHFLGLRRCPECDHLSGRRQTDLCKLGKKATLPDYARSVNLKAPRFSELDIYQVRPKNRFAQEPSASLFSCGRRAAAGTQFSDFGLVVVAHTPLGSTIRGARQGLHRSPMPGPNNCLSSGFWGDWPGAAQSASTD